MYDKLVAKVNNIDISGFVLKTKYDTDKSDLEKKIPDTSGLVKKTDYNAKFCEIESKIPSISGLVSNLVSNLVRKTDYDAKVSDIKSNMLVELITKKLL